MSELLTTLFTVTELERFVAMYYAQLRSSVDFRQSLKSVAFNVLEVLTQNALVNDHFLECLIAERPGQSTEIRKAYAEHHTHKGYLVSQRVRSIFSDGRYPAPQRLNNPGALLTARYEVVPFVKAVRVDELALLEGWWDTDEPTSVRLFLGAGGTGKTRLFLEWSKYLRERNIAAGFLSAAATEDDLNALVCTLEPTLIIIDYSETRPQQLARLLKRAVERKAGVRLRIALLARDEGDWWQALKENDAGVQALLSEVPPYRLQATQLTIAQRKTVLNVALPAFAAALGKDLASIHQDVDLTDDVFGRVLYTLLAALALTDHRSAHPATLLDDTVTHEMRMWGDVDRESRDRRFQRRACRLVGALTLRGQTNSRELATLDQNVEGPDDDIFRDLLETIYRIPDQDQQQAGTMIGGLEPDLLGEALVGRVLADRETGPHFLDTVFQEASDNAITHGFTVLGRLSLWAESAVYPEHWMRRLLESSPATHSLPALQASLSLGTQTADAPLGRILYELLSIFSGPNIENLAAAIDRLIPQSTVSLRELAVWAIHAQLDQVSKQTDETTLKERARLAINLGARLSDLGRREEALQATQEAVKTDRTLAKTRPDTFLPDLADSLNNLGNMLSDLGRRKEALQATQEAVQIRRILAKTRPDDLPYLALSLNNLGNMLSNLYRKEEALQATQEAVQTYRTLVNAKPDAFFPDLALSLSNLGVRLSDLGRREEALQATQEAVQTYRTLAKTRPDAFLPNLASSLNNFGNMLGDLSRREEALQATQEAVQIRRTLAKGRPDAFLPSLALNLNNLGERLSDLGRREDVSPPT